MTPWPPVTYRLNENHEVVKHAADLGELVLPTKRWSVTFTILEDVALEEEATRLKGVFFFYANERLLRGGRISAEEVDRYVARMKDVDPII